MRKPLSHRPRATPYRFLARRPEPPVEIDPVDDPQDAQIARINDLTRAGRANWFGLLAYLAFTLVTVLAVEDADFFIDSRQTQLPLIGVSIPTLAFFIFAPILGAALHVYLHLLIRKSTEALTAAPPVIRGQPLETHVLPWLLNDLVLRWRDDGAAEARVLDSIASVTAILLIWLACPIVLGLMWWVSWPAHNEWLSLGIATCLWFSIYASVASWLKMSTDISRTPPGIGLVGRDLLLTFAAIWLIGVTWLSTQSGWPTGEGPKLARADLADIRFSQLAPEQVDPATARHRFRAEWCDRHGLRPDVCGRGSGYTAPGFQPEMRKRWCNWHPMPEGETCEGHFARLEDEFDAEWEDLRRRTIAALDKPNLKGRDLRNADLSRAELSGVIFTRANLTGAVLEDAQLERAVFTCDPDRLQSAARSLRTQVACLDDAARLDGASLTASNLVQVDLSFAQMEGANLSFAQMEGADLHRARMQGADLRFAQMEGADLSYAQMEGADLSSAQMKGANLRFAEMQGADLSSAQMEGADLSYAQMEGTDFSASEIQRADFSQAQMQGADFSRAQMERARLFVGQMDGAVFNQAQMRGAIFDLANLDGVDFREADLRSIDWKVSRTRGSLVHFADMRGGQYMPTGRLWSLIGNAATLLPESGNHHVCTCWKIDPPGLEHLIALFARYGVSEVELRDPEGDYGFFCAEDELPIRTGTPLSLYADPPWGAQGEDERDTDYFQSRSDWAEAEDARRRAEATEEDICEEPWANP